MTGLIIIPFPGKASGPVSRIEGEVHRNDVGVAVTYRLEGDMAGVRWPAPAEEAARTDGLWRATCFEMFLQPADSPAYAEFNLSPSLDWAVYRFDGYRRGMAETGAMPRSVNLGPVDDHWVAEVEWGFETLPDLARGPLRIGLSAVIEATDGSLSYWALAHPSDKPDFHHPDSFVLTLPEFA